MPDADRAIRREAPLPIYEQLAEIFSNRIATGELPVGARLPTELELARDYAISRETVRQAIGILERCGLVIRRRAKGTFVAAPRVSQDLAQLHSFHGGLLDHGVVPRMELLEYRPAKAASAAAAGFSDCAAMWLLRRYVVKTVPLAIADIYLHPMARTLPWDVAERFDTYTLFERILKRPVARAAATVRAAVAGRAMGGLLQLRPSAPVLVLAQTHHAASGELLVSSSLTVRADAYEFRVDLSPGVPFQDGFGGARVEQLAGRKG